LTLSISPKVVSLPSLQQEVARHLRPASLRALYGDDRVKNGVHCTDLPEDGLLEVRPRPLPTDSSHQAHGSED